MSLINEQLSTPSSSSARRQLFALTFSILCSVLSSKPAFADLIFSCPNDPSKIQNLPQVHILLGSMRPDERTQALQDIIRFLNENSLANHPRVALRLCLDGNLEKLVRALHDVRAIGVVWIGHSSYDVDSQGKPLNAYLLDSQRRILPEFVFYAAQPHMQFLGIATCNENRIRESYHLGNLLRARGLSYYKPAVQKNSLGSQDDGIQKVHKEDIRQVFDRLARTIGDHLTRSRPLFNILEAQTSNQLDSTMTMNIQFCDFFSEHMPYSVLLSTDSTSDGEVLKLHRLRYAGFFNPEKDEFGISKPCGTAKVTVPRHILRGTEAIVIQHGFLNRALDPTQSNFFMDNILLTSLNVAEQPDFPSFKDTEIFHLGDSEVLGAWDQHLQSVALENIPTMDKTPVLRHAIYRLGP